MCLFGYHLPLYNDVSVIQCESVLTLSYILSYEYLSELVTFFLVH